MSWLALVLLASGAAPEILHMPLHERRAEQGILRPVPISVVLPRDMALRARRVLVHYRLWGEPDWTSIELLGGGGRYEGAIPCLEISTVTGDLRYYLRVHDGEGRVIATGASRASPYVVTIKHDSMMAPRERTARCPDPADCPRGLPGCPSERVVKISCKVDSDCEDGTSCSWQGYCERVERRKNWTTLSVQQDIGIIATEGACTLASQENEGYSCIRVDGAQYDGTPVAVSSPLHAGRGPLRVIVGYDRLLHYNTSLGVRFGWIVFGDGPTAREGTKLVRFSAAARISHWLGDDPFARTGFRPYLFVTGGYAMGDIATGLRLREDPTAPVFQGGNDLEQEVDLYKRAGDGFAGAGVGLAYAFTSGFAASLELAGLGVFPFTAFVLAPAAGVMVGF